jgi:hypothetical protein
MLMIRNVTRPGPWAGICPECGSDDTTPCFEWPVEDERAITLRAYTEAEEAIELNQKKKTMQ